MSALRLADHAVVVGSLRACIERGNERVTMIPLPVDPDAIATVDWDGHVVDETTWRVPGLAITVRGPLPAGMEYMTGDYALRFTKSARVDLSVWDQGDRSVYWQPGLEYTGDSPWFGVAAPAADGT